MLVKCMVPGYKGDADGVLPHEECLACAAAGENRCGFDYALLNFIYRNRESRPDIHVTDLTGCLLRSYWEKRTEVPRFAHEQMAVSLGSIVHGLLDEPSDVTENEFDLAKLGIKGRGDVYYPALGRLVDFKTTRWLNPANLPYGSHILQVNIYAELMRRSDKPVESAAVQYIDLSGPTKCRACKLPLRPEPDGLRCPNCSQPAKNSHLGAVLYEVDLLSSEEITEMIVQRRDALVLAQEMDSPPDAEPSFLCNYCSFIDMCSEGQTWQGRQRPGKD